MAVFSLSLFLYRCLTRITQYCVLLFESVADECESNSQNMLCEWSMWLTQAALLFTASVLTACAQHGRALRDACSPAEGRCERGECLGVLSAPALVCNHTVVPYRRCGATRAPCQGELAWRSPCPSAMSPVTQFPTAACAVLRSNG